MAKSEDWKLTRYEMRAGAAWITLDSPGNRNALSEVLVSELHARLLEAMGDSDVRLVVLTGKGPAFCAGADLKQRGGGAGGGSADNPFVRVMRLMREGPKPVICAVNGHAFGGGIGLVASADIAIGVDSAKFSFSEVRLGLIPAMISVAVLPKVGEHDTMRLFLTGERFSAAEAKGYGLLHRVVEASELEAAVSADADAIARGGPIAIAEAKQLVRTVSRVSTEEGFAYAAEKIAGLFSGGAG
jgi:methylglutaconyl-CoA hydratase